MYQKAYKVAQEECTNFGTSVNRQNVPFMVQYNHSQGRNKASQTDGQAERLTRRSKTRVRTDRSREAKLSKATHHLPNAKRKGEKKNESERDYQ